MAEYTTLFTEKYITDKLKLNEFVIPNLENKLSVISRWIKENKDKTIYNKKEEQLQSDFLNDIFGEVLGYAYKRGLDIYNLEKEEKSKTDGTKPDGSLGYFTKDNMDTRVVIELKDAYTDLDHKQNRKNDNRTPVEQAFSYVSKCGGKCQWVIVSNFREIRLYPANDSSIYQKFMIEKLDDIIVLKQFYALLAKDMLFLEKGVSSTDSLLSLKIEGDANISKEFYTEYKKHRSILFNHIKENNPNIDENTILTKSQKILDRIIFICFCEDKGLIPHKTFRKILEQTKNNSFDRRKDKLWQTVKGLFDAIDKGYNRKEAIKTKKETNTFLPIIDGADIKNRSYAVPNKYFDFRKDMIKSGGDYNVYNRTRLVIRQIGVTPIVGVCEKGILTSNTLYNVFEKNDKSNLMYILGILTSNFIKYYWLSNYYDKKQLFPKIKKYQIMQLPIPNISITQQGSLIDLVDIVLLKNKELQNLFNKFFRLLQGDFKDIEINNSIKSCFDADWSNFVNILKRQKISLLGILKDDWSDRFNRYKTDIDNIKSVIADTDKKIDTLVYQLYGLTDDEIKIIEESLKN